jgi:hypothetical protein
MIFHPSALAIFLAITLPAAAAQAQAQAGNLKYDVSGQPGARGEAGQAGGSGAGYFRSCSGYSRHSPSDSRNGSHGRDGGDGGTAGSIDVTIGFVEGTDGKEVYIRGQKLVGSRLEQINDRVPTSSLRSLSFVANGGSGGSGGKGGDGGQGARGCDGSDGRSLFFSHNLNGENGGHGEDGGNGGDGGRGGRGGDAGSIKVTLAPGAELLAPLVAVEARPGQGGPSGREGMGGSGGRGGRGGSGSCEDGSSSWGWDKTDQEGRTIRCGRSGNSGQAGRSGKQGRTMASGSAGKAVQSSFVYSNGAPVTGRYRLQVAGLSYGQEIPDGVVEPKEELSLKAVTLRNTGNAPVPPAQYTVTLPGGLSLQLNQKRLDPGQTVQIPLETPLSLSAPAAGQVSVPATITLDHVRSGIDSLPEIPVLQPVTLVQSSDLNLTSLSRDGELQFTVRNQSQVAYGSESPIGRGLKLQLIPSGPGLPLIEVAPGRFEPMPERLELAIPQIAPGESRTIRLKVKAAPDWKPGQAFEISPQLAIERSRVAPAEGRASRLAYKIDPNDGLQKVFDVTELGVTCQFYKSLWFNYPVAAVSIIKEKGSDNVTVKIRLQDKREGPEYKTTMRQIPARLRESLLNERPFTSADLKALLEKAEGPRADRGWAFQKSKWDIRSCHAGKNRQGGHEIRASADGDIFQHLAMLNGQPDSTGSAVIESRVPAKRMVSSEANGPVRQPEAIPQPSRDAR